MNNNDVITVNTISYTGLQNDEFLGMQQKFVVFTDTITTEALKSSVTAYKDSVSTLSAHMALDGEESVQHSAMRLHDARVETYNAFYATVKQLTKLDDSASVALGKTYLAIFEGHENLRDFNQDGASSIVNGVITAFRKHTTEELTNMGVERWVAMLEKRETEYEAAAKARGEEADSRIERLTRKYRDDCVLNFEILANHARALAIRNNDASCRDFIEQVNGEMALRKEKLKMRRNAAKKKNEASAKTESSNAETAKVETVTESDSTEAVKAVA